MSKILSDLWDNDFPLDERRERRNLAESELTDRLEKYYEHLKKVLPENEIESVEKYDDCIWDLLAVTNRENFILGFRLGVRLIFEAFSKD